MKSFSSGGWSTHNYSSSYSGHGFASYFPARAALANPRNDTIPGLIQPTYCESSTVNNYVLPHDATSPYRGMDQWDVGRYEFLKSLSWIPINKINSFSIVAGRHTHNHPSTYSHHNLATHLFTNSTSENPQNVVVPFFSRATHDGGSTMNTYLQAPCDGRRDVELLGDALERYCPIDRANVQCDIQR